LDKTRPRAAKVEVLHAGFGEPLSAVALWSEYAQTYQDGNPIALWNSHPTTMLAKCAEAQALRRAFPEELGGLNTDDEIPQHDDTPAPAVDLNAPSSRLRQLRTGATPPETVIVPDAEIGTPEQVASAPPPKPTLPPKEGATETLLAFKKAVDACADSKALQKASLAWIDRLSKLSDRPRAIANGYAAAHEKSMAGGFPTDAELATVDQMSALASAGPQAKLPRAARAIVSKSALDADDAKAGQ
jgi:hypothetical protein